MDRMPLGLDELVERWTVLEDDQKLIAGKRGPTRPGFALLLKFFTQYGRFPEGRSELPDEAVEWVARQVKVPASDLGFYEWSNSSTLKYHRAQIRRHFGFRECSVADQRSSRTGWPPMSRTRSGTGTRSARNCSAGAGRNGSSRLPPTGLPGSSGRRCTKRSRSGSPSSLRGSPPPAPRDPLSPWSAPGTATSPMSTGPTMKMRKTTVAPAMTRKTRTRCWRWSSRCRGT
jgi:hypothetical protein